MSIVKLLIACTVLMQGCGILSKGKGSRSRADKKDRNNSGPVITQVPPKDQKAFDAIFGLNPDDVFKKEVDFLRARGHDLSWYPTSRGNVAQHNTVQVIYFGAVDRVIGWCSGAFVGSNKISTAGHCHSTTWRFDLEPGKSCRGKVIFAIKEKDTSETEYYECLNLDVSTFDGDDFSKPGVLKDFAIFSLKKDRASTPEYNFNFYYQFQNHETETKPLTKKMVGDAVVALVVDPPVQYGKFASSYDIVTAQVVAQAFQAEAIYLKKDDNDTQKGNSGGPFYLIDKNDVFDIKESPIDASTFSYLAPKYGWAYGTTLLGTYETLIVVSSPAAIAEDFLKGLNR